MRGKTTLHLSGSALLIICLNLCMQVASCRELMNACGHRNGSSSNGINHMALESEQENSTSLEIYAHTTAQWGRIINNGQFVSTSTGVVANIMTFRWCILPADRPSFEAPGSDRRNSVWLCYRRLHTHGSETRWCIHHRLHCLLHLALSFPTG